MKKKLISHEVPLKLLSKSREFNDYDYALVHLFDKYSEYFQFFKKSLELNRIVILDNSVFELDESFDIDKFARYVDELRPTEYIIPDVLENYEQTVDNIIQWWRYYKDLPGKKIGVVQGKNYKELKECYKEINPYVDKIAISFDYFYYEQIIPHKNKCISWLSGRISLLTKFLEENVIDLSKPHHLLGCSLPQEFLSYKFPQFSFIESIDTSNPVIHGLKGIYYNDWGLIAKESVKLSEIINCSIINEKIIEFNIDMFREFVNGDSIVQNSYEYKV